MIMLAIYQVLSKGYSDWFYHCTLFGPHQTSFYSVFAYRWSVLLNIFAIKSMLVWILSFTYCYFLTLQLPLLHKDLFSSGLCKRSGVLLYGPPGTGKVYSDGLPNYAQPSSSKYLFWDILYSYFFPILIISALNVRLCWQKL